MKKLALLSIFLALPLCAQFNLIDQGQLAPNFVAFGGGIQEGGRITGNTAICHAVGSVRYLCAKSSLSGGTTATTAEVKQIVAARYGFAVALDGSAGLATGANAGTGLAVSAGGSVLYNVSRLKFLRDHPGWWVGFSGKWDKRDVDEFVRVRTVAALRPFASRGLYDFFAGYAW